MRACDLCSGHADGRLAALESYALSCALEARGGSSVANNIRHANLASRFREQYISPEGDLVGLV